MMRALLALLALLSPAAIPLSQPAPDDRAEPMSCFDCGCDPCATPLPSAPSGPEVALVLDDSLLPAPTGFFVVPVLVDRPAQVRLETLVNAWDDSDDVSAWAVLTLGDPAWTSFVSSSGGAGLWHSAGVNAGSNVVACCPTPPDSPFWSTSLTGSGSEGESYHDVTPESPLWLGLVAYHWDPESQLRFIARSYEPSLRLGTVLTGEDVVAVDLVRRAIDAGTNVETYGALEAGEAGDAEVAWESAGTGFLSLTYSFWGDGSGDVLARLPDHSVYDNSPRWKTTGTVHALQPGAFTISLHDLQVPRRSWPQPLGAGSGGQAQALALFANLPLEPRPTWAWQNTEADAQAHD